MKIYKLVSPVTGVYKDEDNFVRMRTFEIGFPLIRTEEMVDGSRVHKLNDFASYSEDFLDQNPDYFQGIDDGAKEPKPKFVSELLQRDQVSDCHEAPLILIGPEGEVLDQTQVKEGSTYYYACSQCGKQCDAKYI